ncbi:MAG: hypothetical protein IK045_02650 [Bacteroidales bacterium]|nr:hypothetical protein [Bacteroidales bacterium]
MKKITIILLAALSLAAVSCNKENTEVASDSLAPAGNSLVARFAQDEVKTAFVDGTYMWKKNDNMVVRSDNANGYTVYKYTGEDTAGEAEFVPNTDDNIVYGQNSFAIYPAKVSGSGASAYPKEEEGSLKPVLKDTYTWFDGNVEAPMLARVEAGQPLEFKHLGGVLKVTYKNVPPKAAKILVVAPVVDPDLIAAGKVTYKTNATMNKTYNWTTEGGGFDPTEIPYVKAYDHSGTYKMTVSLANATAAQKASDSGITAYIPLPVGPVEVDGKNVYPKLDVCLAFADNTIVPGSQVSASNVQIDRAHIKPMPAITLTKYSVEVVAGTDGSNATTNGTGTSAKFNQVRGLCWLDNTNLLLTESNGSKVLRKYNKSTHAVSSAVTLGGSAPWQGCLKDGVFYFADKGGNKVRSWNTSTNAVADVVTTGLNNPMCVRFNGNDAYVGCRNGSVIYKWTGGFSGTKSTFFDCSTLEHGSDTNWPLAIGFDSDGNLLLTMSTAGGTSPSGYKVYVISPAGEVLTAIGKGTKSTNFGALTDGSISSATFGSNMNGLVYGPDGAIYMLDDYSVRRITKGASGWSDATVMTILGGGNNFISSVGALTQITQTPQDIIFDPENSNVFYFFDWRYTLRKVTITK